MAMTSIQTSRIAERFARVERKNRIGPPPKTYWGVPMRLCPWVGAGIRRRAAWNENLNRTVTDGVRVQSPRLKRPNNYRNLDPPARFMIPAKQKSVAIDKNPSDGNRQGEEL